jgi:proteasome activator subunit 4
LLAVRSIWAGLPTFILERPKTVANPCIHSEIECPDLIVPHLSVEAGFSLADPNDPRYKKVEAHRNRFGQVSRSSASALRERHSTDEDHTDAVIAVVKSIDVFLLDYGMGKSNWSALQKSFAQAREYVSPLLFSYLT